MVTSHGHEAVAAAAVSHIAAKVGTGARLQAMAKTYSAAAVVFPIVSEGASRRAGAMVSGLISGQIA